MRSILRSTAAVALLGLALAGPVDAQSTTDREKLTAQSRLTTAEAALASAQAAGAATFATDLYNDASNRLREARTNWSHDNRNTREMAALRAVEAHHAALAAEAQANLLAANSEIRTLRTDIGTFGGTAATIDLYEPPAMTSRGVTSADRVIIAENAIRMARAAGAERFAANDLERIEGTLKTARTLAKNDKQNDNADHLAYVAEMEARRLELVARRNAISPRLPELRAERTRLAQRAQDMRAQEEQQRRLAAEQQAAELRRQLEQQSTNRQAEQAELQRLREQVAHTEMQFRTQLDQDRAARIAAEQQLDEVMRRYEAALTEDGANAIEVENLRRQVEDQSLALRTMQERERASEAYVGTQIQSLEQALERERAEGQLTADVLAQREEELRRQRADLQRLQTEREESARLRAEAERVRTEAIADAERRRSLAEAEAEQLRQQVAQTSAALSTAQEELLRRDTVARERVETMQQELARLAETRQTERGFIVTLPGLFFDTGSATLKSGARNTLSKIADQLRVNVDTRITVEGHTDAVGSEELNQSLSERRAAAVRDYLVSRGVPADRISMTGLGESAPIATNDSPAGRQQNRRVELVIAQ
ncbi:MAG TPA: OmpA family protein [Thermoanaerobaculia bacterium]|nr:OmpA family protein [Thermoanaerobaculia bacterium]